MIYEAVVTYAGERERFEVEGPNYYDCKIEAAKKFLELHPIERPHDDQRRPYDIGIRPYWLVNNGYVHLKNTVDRRVKY